MAGLNGLRGLFQSDDSANVRLFLLSLNFGLASGNEKEENNKNLMLKDTD